MNFQTTDDYFKRNISLKEKPLSTTFPRRLLIYLVSFFLPPFGVWPAIKYLRQPDEKSKRTGWVALFLTIISIVITSWLMINFVNSFGKELGGQFNFYEGIDY